MNERQNCRFSYKTTNKNTKNKNNLKFITLVQEKIQHLKSVSILEKS